MSAGDKAGRTVLIGAGRMGAALASGWLRKRGALEPADLLIVDPGRNDHCKQLVSAHGLKRVRGLGPRMAKDVSTIVLAVKPQQFDELGPRLGEILPKDAAVISVIAGISVRRLKSALGERPIIRAMPNTPAAIGKGITVAVASDASASVKRQAEKLLKVGGPVEWITDERHMGAVTAVSGSATCRSTVLVRVRVTFHGSVSPKRHSRLAPVASPVAPARAVTSCPPSASARA